MMLLKNSIALLAALIFCSTFPCEYNILFDSIRKGDKLGCADFLENHDLSDVQKDYCLDLNNRLSREYKEQLSFRYSALSRGTLMQAAGVGLFFLAFEWKKFCWEYGRAIGLSDFVRYNTLDFCLIAALTYAGAEIYYKGRFINTLRGLDLKDRIYDALMIKILLTHNDLLREKGLEGLQEIFSQTNGNLLKLIKEDSETLR